VSADARRLAPPRRTSARAASPAKFPRAAWSTGRYAKETQNACNSDGRHERALQFIRLASGSLFVSMPSEGMSTSLSLRTRSLGGRTTQ